MSVDADRSSIFYTKDIESEQYIKIITTYLDFKQNLKILDIGSNRGSMFKYFEKKFKKIIYDAVEPNKYISKNYKNKINNFYATRFEKIDVLKNNYDFVLCVHTLEHFINPLLMLSKIYDSLKIKGKFLISVPNTDIGMKNDIISEYFIDTHNFHFNRSNLKKFLNKVGFKILFTNSSNEDAITYLCEKTKFNKREKVNVENNKTLFMSNKNKIENYKNSIKQNRKKIKNIANYLNKISNNKKIIIWGAGRIFDGLIKIGKLNNKSIHYLTDKYLYKYKKKIHNIKLIDPRKLEKIKKNETIVFISSIAYANEIKKDCINLGFKSIIKFNINEKNLL